MGRHDVFDHLIHTSKRVKFTQAKPSNAFLHQHNLPPQTLLRKTNASNRYLGRGRGRS